MTARLEHKTATAKVGSRRSTLSGMVTGAQMQYLRDEELVESAAFTTPARRLQ
jgi:hypothetical protein